jgi:hypothetical protein
MNEMFSISFPDAQHGWIFGDNGNILYLNDQATDLPENENKEIINSIFIAYPCPCSSTLKIRFKIYNSGYTMCDLVDISGRKIKHLLNEYRKPGTYEMEFDLRDLPAGIYFCTLKTNDPECSGQTRKIIKL